MIQISLSRAEFYHAAMIGMTRQLANLNKKRQDRYGCSKEDGWRAHVEGACGEACVAKHLNIFWSGNINDLSAADVGSLQVRTRSKDYYDLIVHERDPDDDKFILVTGMAPDFIIRGWITGKDAKDEKWWKDPAGGRPAFFVPQNSLYPMSDLMG